MPLLVLDSSSDVSRVLLVERGQPGASSARRGRPLQNLHVGIVDTLAGAGVGFADLFAVAVICGPGSWTGLHVAVTTAKTIAQLCGIPLVPLSLLDALAWSHVSHRGTIVTAVDARNGNLYAAVYRADGRSARCIRPAQRIPAADLVRELSSRDGSVLYVGEGIPADSVGDGVLSPYIEPLPEALCALATQATEDAALEGDDRLTLEPLYLSDEGAGLTPYTLPR